MCIRDSLSFYVIGYDESLAKWPFADIAEGNSAEWYYGAVKYVYENGIFTGTSAAAFSPDSPLTRATLVTVMARLSGVDLETYRLSTFNDVTANSWYGPSVAWAKEAGVISGFKNPDGSFSFKPDANISRQDIAVVLNNYNEKIAKKVYDKAEAVSFSDYYRIGEYAAGAVSAMQQAGIISGIKNQDGSYEFRPLSNATRAEAAVLIYNMVRK